MADTEIQAPETTGTELPAFTPAGEKDLGAREAARGLAKWRQDRVRSEAEDKLKEPAGAKSAAEVSSDTETPAQADDAAPLPEAPGETKEKPEPAETPPIEAPRSWTKAEKEEFATYPREAQEKIARREQERDRAVRQSQNEAAEIRKAVEAEKEAVAKAREHYDTALPALLQTLQQQQAGEFSDIKTMEDVTRLAREDWPRYILWDAGQKKLAAVQQEIRSSQERRQTEYKAEWEKFSKREDELFIEKVPELADKEKFSKVGDAALGVLKDKGFTDTELGQLWSGQRNISLRDHRLQLLVHDSVRYSQAQEAAKKAAAKPLPAVQKPGVAQPKGAAVDAQLEALKAKAEKSGNPRDMAKFVAERRRLAR